MSPKAAATAKKAKPQTDTEGAHVKPSFAKSLFLSECLDELIVPFRNMKAAEVSNLKDMIDALEKAFSTIDSFKIDAQHAIPPSVIEDMKGLGLFGVIIPEEHGGLGLSSGGYSRIMQQLASIDASLAVTCGAHSSIGMKALLLFGTQEQKKKYLPKLATGEWIAAFGLTEPGSGSDAASIKTTATLDADGKTWTLNGQKLWITNGGLAHFFTVFAKTEEKGTGKARVTAFIVTRDMQGFSTGPEEKKMGIRGSSTVPLHFDNVKIPMENVLGEVGKGFKVAMEVLNNGRSGIGGGGVGGLKLSIKRAIAHAKERQQFNRPIASYGLVQEKIARMAMLTYVSESLVGLITGLMDGDDGDYSMEAAVTKVYVSEALWYGVNEALQIAGGLGFMQEYPYERAVRDSRINMIYEGTNEVLRLFIGLSGLKDVGEYLKEISKGVTDAFQDPIKAFGVLRDYASKQMKRRLIPENHFQTLFATELADQADKLEKLVMEFGTACEQVIQKYKKDIIEQQMQTKRVADVLIDIVASMATLSRCSSRISSQGADKVSLEIDMTKMFCREARQRIELNLRRLNSNDDELTYRIAKHLIEKEKYEWDLI